MTPSVDTLDDVLRQVLTLGFAHEESEEFGLVAALLESNGRVGSASKSVEFAS